MDEIIQQDITTLKNLFETSGNNFIGISDGIGVLNVFKEQQTHMKKKYNDFEKSLNNLNIYNMSDQLQIIYKNLIELNNNLVLCDRCQGLIKYKTTFIIPFKNTLNELLRKYVINTSTFVNNLKSTLLKSINTNNNITKNMINGLKSFITQSSVNADEVDTKKFIGLLVSELKKNIAYRQEINTLPFIKSLKTQLQGTIKVMPKVETGKFITNLTSVMNSTIKQKQPQVDSKVFINKLASAITKSMHKIDNGSIFSRITNFFSSKNDDTPIGIKAEKPVKNGDNFIIINGKLVGKSVKIGETYYNPGMSIIINPDSEEKETHIIIRFEKVGWFGGKTRKKRGGGILDSQVKIILQNTIKNDYPKDTKIEFLRKYSPIENRDETYSDDEYLSNLSQGKRPLHNKRSSFDQILEDTNEEMIYPEQILEKINEINTLIDDLCDIEVNTDGKIEYYDRYGNLLESSNCKSSKIISEEPSPVKNTETIDDIDFDELKKMSKDERNKFIQEFVNKINSAPHIKSIIILIFKKLNEKLDRLPKDASTDILAKIIKNILDKILTNDESISKIQTELERTLTPENTKQFVDQLTAYLETTIQDKSFPEKLGGKIEETIHKYKRVNSR
jgi:hypothetical protein